jgi:hypothetical protein
MAFPMLSIRTIFMGGISSKCGPGANGTQVEGQAAAVTVNVASCQL